MTVEKVVVGAMMATVETTTNAIAQRTYFKILHSMPSYSTAALTAYFKMFHSISSQPWFSDPL